MYLFTSHNPAENLEINKNGCWLKEFTETTVTFHAVDMTRADIFIKH